jgi:hypothetical protein
MHVKPREEEEAPTQPRQLLRSMEPPLALPLCNDQRWHERWHEKA